MTKDTSDLFFLDKFSIDEEIFGDSESDIDDETSMSTNRCRSLTLTVDDDGRREDDVTWW